MERKRKRSEKRERIEIAERTQLRLCQQAIPDFATTHLQFNHGSILFKAGKLAGKSFPVLYNIESVQGTTADLDK
jgi:hypothetical protein